MGRDWQKVFLMEHGSVFVSFTVPSSNWTPLTHKLNPEQQARKQIDGITLATGWAVQDCRKFNPGAHFCEALNEVMLLFSEQTLCQCYRSQTLLSRTKKLAMVVKSESVKL